MVCTPPVPNGTNKGNFAFYTLLGVSVWTVDQMTVLSKFKSCTIDKLCQVVLGGICLYQWPLDGEDATFESMMVADLKIVFRRIVLQLHEKRCSWQKIPRNALKNKYVANCSFIEVRIKDNFHTRKKRTQILGKFLDKPNIEDWITVSIQLSHHELFLSCVVCGVYAQIHPFHNR